MTKLLPVVLIGLLLAAGCTPSGTDEQEAQATKTIEDTVLHIEWTAKLSQRDMTFSDALEYCRRLRYAGHDDWRLPTKAELESLILPDLIPSSPTASTVPLRGPFTKVQEGHIFSGTLVQGNDQCPYILNIRNGALFNGKGYTGFVLAVRDKRFKSK